jgi:outer membrane protein assembly factor BamB
MRFSVGVIGLFMLIVQVSFVPLRAEDWPSYRRDRTRSAVTSEKLDTPLANVWYYRSRLARLAPKYLPIRAKETKAFGASAREPLPEHIRYALPIIAAGGSVFFTSSDGRVVCLDARTGTMRWEFVTGGAISCAANYSSGKIYVGSDDAHVYCLDAKTGKLVWKHKPVSADRWFISFGRMSSIWPVRSDVLVDDGTAYFSAGIFPHDGMYVSAIDTYNAKRLWRSVCYGYGFAGPIFATKSTLILPTEMKGFHRHQVKYRRSNGVLSSENDPEVDQHRELLNGGGGVVKDGVRYTSNFNDAVMARKIEDENKQGGRKAIWGRRVSNMIFDPRDTAYAGGVVLFAGNEVRHDANADSAGGLGGVILALDAKDGRKLWATTIPERTHQMAIADGRLFVSTRSGSIYCYAAQGTPARGVIDESVVSDPFANHPARNQCRNAAHRILAPHTQNEKGVGLEGKGFALVLDCDSGLLAYELAKRSSLFVCAVFDDAAKAQRARETFTRANMHGSRISVWHRRPGAKLPYSPNFADFVVSERAALGGALPEYTAELERLLKPIRGVALIGGKQQEAAIKAWAADKKPGEWRTFAQHEMNWATHTRPPLKDAGGWTHANGTSGNTMCSQDGALKPPLGIVWNGPPYSSVMFSRPPLLHNGVLVCPVDDHYLEAYDAYNGRRLWRFAPPKYSQRDATRNFRLMAAGGDSLFIPDGNVQQGATNQGIIRLDLWTGKLLSTYRLPFPEMRMGTFAVSPDGKTLWRSGYGDKTETQGDWSCLLAINTETGKVRWTLGGPGEKKPFGLYREKVPYESWSALADGRIYILRAGPSELHREQLDAEMKAYLKANDPSRLAGYEERRHQYMLLTAIDAQTGKMLYQHAVDTFASEHNVVAHNNKVIFTTRDGGKWWDGWPRKNSIAVHDGATGKLLWKKPANYRFEPVVTDETIYAEPWAFDLATGRKRQQSHPITGEKSDWSWVRANKQCGGCSGSTHFLFGRNKGFGYHDVLRDHGMYTSWHHRQACSADTTSGSGMMIKPPFNTGCGCPWSMPYTMAMAQLNREPAIPFETFQTGRSLPVKHLRVNFGANGDRRDKRGNMWLHSRRRVNRNQLHLTFSSPAVFYPGGDDSQWGIDRSGRRSIGDVPVENTDVPIVFDAFALGLKRYAVPVTTPADGKGVFKVRLGFCSLENDRAGQRVFDVRICGKTVLKRFDVVREAGKVNSAIWREFTLPLDGTLVLDLVSPLEHPTLEQLPIICGMEVVREKFTTLGWKAPNGLWLGQTKAESDVVLQIANFRQQPFKGRLVIESSAGIQVSLPGNGAIELLPDVRQEMTVHLRATGAVTVGSHRLLAKLVSNDGSIELQRKMTVDWLGPLEREVLRAATIYRDHPTGRKAWMRRVRPPHYAGELPVSSGFKLRGDRGTSHAYLSFSVPAEIGKIHKARVQLRVAPELWAIRQAMFGRAGDVGGPRSKSYWGGLKQIQGSPSPSVNELKYPDRPTMLPEIFALAPKTLSPNIVEAPVPSDVPRDKNGNGSIQFAIEPTALNGPVYWSSHGSNLLTENMPALVIDYEPMKKTP